MINYQLPNFKLQTPNSKIQKSKIKYQSSNSKLQILPDGQAGTNYQGLRFSTQVPDTWYIVHGTWYNTSYQGLRFSTHITLYLVQYKLSIINYQLPKCTFHNKWYMVQHSTNARKQNQRNRLIGKGFY